MEDIDFSIKEYLIREGNITEGVIGKRMKRKKVRFSDTSRENIIIETTERNSVIVTKFMFRTSLIMSDQGFGSGYRKGVKIRESDAREFLRMPSKGRQKKKFLNKPIWGMVARLTEIASASIAQEAINAHKILQ